MMSFCVVPWSAAGSSAVLLGGDDVERQQPRRGRVDRHRRVHLVQRDAVEQRVHVALVGDRDADLADLAARELVVGVVAGLGGQVEGDRQARLALGRGSSGTARWTSSRSNAPRRCASSTAGRARAGGGPWLDCMVHGRMPDPREIDVHHLGNPLVICCFQLDGVLVDPGPESSHAHAAGGARRRAPERILLTHIHFDHAGATGALVRRWPDVEVWVHERGAPHLIDPSRLSPAPRASTATTWSACGARSSPVPEANLRVLSGGESDRAAGASSTRPATPRTTSATCTSPPARPSSATSAACASPAGRSSRPRRRRTSTSSSGTRRWTPSRPGSRARWPSPTSARYEDVADAPRDDARRRCDRWARARARTDAEGYAAAMTPDRDARPTHRRSQAFLQAMPPDTLARPAIATGPSENR